MAHHRIYRINQIKEVTGLGSNSVYLFMKKGLFPKQFKLSGAKEVRWSGEETAHWVADRLASRTGQPLTFTEQEELTALLARFPEMGAEPDASEMTVHELRGLLRFLQRKAQEGIYESR